ncbi:39S ribosomal protein L46, mitochondrial [Trematomus bernacchii]|uniref:39S ribosomal protein L46, mitochondrial n=1 Tax=Trematomus bernacchii TaxID=40690 RepID=UPI001469C064|nr:39S ribosomal protein L46, mitochondrial [Trematomus bernacchii]
MAAPCRRMAGRSLLQFLSSFSRTSVSNSGFRQFSSTSVCRGSNQAQHVEERASSPWTLMAAVCLQRLPVISAESNPIEQQFRDMMIQMELEKSMLSDHELRLLDDAERLRRMQAGEYDSDEEEDRRDQEIVLAQDLEDSWEQKLNNFQPAARVSDSEGDPGSLQRCLSDSLLLLVERPVGSEKLWMLPQTEWQRGETLRETAERALSSLPAASGFKATFLGNTPCGVYKYKLPRAARTESSVGTKVFFFKAVLSDASAPPATESPESSLLWVTKSELQRYVKPAYLRKVERFLLGF